MKLSTEKAVRRLSLGRLVSQSTVMLMASIGTLILVLALLILFHENSTATKGYELRGLERERSMLLLEQEVLNMQIAESQSLQHLQNDPQITSMLTVTKAQFAKFTQSGSTKKP